MADTGTVREPTHVIGRKTRRHSVLFGLNKAGLVVMAAYLAGALAALVLLEMRPSLAVIALLLGVVVYMFARNPQNAEKEPVWRMTVDWAQATWTRMAKLDAFTQSDALPVPRPVGDVLMLAVAPVETGPEQLVVRHSPTGMRGAYFTATLEIEGRGEGVRSAMDYWRDVVALERVMNKLAERRVPVDEISIMVRALPGLPSAYKDEVWDMTDKNLVDTPMGRNIRQRFYNLDGWSDMYRMYVTVSMPEEALGRAVAAQGRRVDREALTDGALLWLGKVGDQLESAGFAVVGGLGPRRFGALLRHLYAPSFDIDDLSGIVSAMDGFRNYPQPLTRSLAVPDYQHDVVWHHATGVIAPYGWPASDVTSRWMLPAVAQMFDDDVESVIRTITTTWRLVDRRQAQQLLKADMTNVQTEMARAADEFTGGESADQHKHGSRIATDLRNQAHGVIPSIRVTCSAPSKVASDVARDLVEATMSDMAVDAFEWCDGRQADAMILSLPLGRGIPRAKKRTK